MQLEHTLTFDELSQAWLGMMDGSAYPAGQPSLHGYWRSSGFCGMSEDQMRDAIAHGYAVPGMDLKAGRQTRERRKARLSEDEGELQIDLALSGHDRPYMHRPRVKRQAGLKVNFELGFRASTPASVLIDYAKWMGSLITGLQARNFDLEVNVVSNASHVTTTGRGTRTVVRVKRFGKRSDMKSWGAMLSPGGFRMLVFAGRLLTCHKHGQTCTLEMGGSTGRSWGLEHDAKTNTLTVKVAASTQRFPREQLDRELSALQF